MLGTGYDFRMSLSSRLLVVSVRNSLEEMQKEREQVGLRWCLAAHRSGTLGQAETSLVARIPAEISLLTQLKDLGFANAGGKCTRFWMLKSTSIFADGHQSAKEGNLQKNLYDVTNVLHIFMKTNKQTKTIK